MVFCAFSAVTPVSEGVEATGLEKTDLSPFTDDNSTITGDATNGWVVKLKKDVDVSKTFEVAGKLTIDLNGCTIAPASSAGSAFDIFNIKKGNTDAVDFKIIDSSEKKDGKITNTSEEIFDSKAGTETKDGKEVAVKRGNYTFSVDGGIFETTTGYAFILREADSTSASTVDLSFKNATISGAVGIWASYNEIRSLTVDTCEITSTGIGIYNGTVLTTEIKNSTITATSGTAVEIKAGDVTITDSEITGNEYEIGEEIGNSGSGGSVSAVIVNNGYTNAADMAADSNVKLSIDGLTSIVNNAADSKAIIVTDGATDKQKNTIVVKWEGNDSKIGHKFLTKYTAKENGKDVEKPAVEGGLIVVNTTAFANDATMFSSAASMSEEYTLTKVVVESDMTLSGTLNFDEKNSITLTNAAVKKGVSFEKGSVIINGIVCTSGEISIAGDSTIYGDFSGTSITVTEDTNLTIPAGKTLTMGGAAAIKMKSNSTVNILGTLEKDTTSTANNLVENDTSATGTAVQIGPDATTPENFTEVETKQGSDEMRVNSFETLKDFCNSSVSNIVLSANIIVSSDLRVKDTTTLDLGTFTLTLTNGVTFVNDGKVVSTKQMNTIGASGEDIEFVDGTFVNNGVLEIEGNLTVPAGCKFFNNETMTITGTLTVLGEFENSGTLTCTNAAGAITVGDGSTSSGALFENSGLLYVAGNITVNEKAKFENSGAIAAADRTAANSLSVSGNGTFENIGKGVVGFAVNTSTVIGVAYDVEMTVDITQDTTYGTLQNVIVPEGKTLTIQRTASLTIMGKLIVYGTLNVEGNLIVASNAGASMEVAGTVNIVDNTKLKGTIQIGKTGSPGEPGHLVVDAGAKLAAQDGTTLNLTKGSIVIDGALEMQTGSILKSGVVDCAAAKKDVPASGIVFSEGAQVTLNGIFDGTGTNTVVNVLNFGSVVVDNGSNTKAAKAGSFKVQLASADANVVIKSLFLKTAGDKATITDDGLVLKNDKDASKIVKVGDTKNTVEFGPRATNGEYTVLSGELTITEKVSSKKVSGKVQYTNAMDVSGQISAANKYESAPSEYGATDITKVIFTGGGAISVTNDDQVSKVTGGIAVEGDFILGSLVALENRGSLKVSGNVTNNGTDAQQIVNNGTITVTGLITCSAEINNKGTINAASYVIKNTVEKKVVTTYLYSTLETAVKAVADPTNENTLKEVVLMGKNTVLNSFEVPKGITVTFEDRNGILFVGDKKNRDITLTFADGAVLETVGKGQVDVYATLTFVNKTNDETQATISDVKVESEDKTGKVTYTNIYSALEGAEKGDTVTVTRTSGNVEITQSLTVPAEVTLVVPDNATNLKVMDGMTLTIDGTLVTDLEILAEHVFSTTAMDIDKTTTDVEKKSSVIIVNGTLKMNTGLGFEYGADTADNLFRAPVAGAYYEIDGYDYVSTLAIAASQAAVAESDIVINGIVTAGDVEFTGTDNCPSIIVVKGNVTGMDGNTVYTALTVSSLKVTDGALVVNGGFNGTVNVADAVFTATKVTGVTITDDETDGMVITEKIGMAENTKFGEASASLTAGTAVIKTTSTGVDFTVAAGATVVSDGAKFICGGYANELAGILYIDGTVSVASAKNLKADIIVVNDGGSLSVAAMTDTTAPGIAEIAELFVGLDFEDVYTLGAAASVSGPVTVAYAAYVAAGSTVDEVAQKIMDAKPHTEFFIEDSLWMTVYDFTTDNIYDVSDIAKAPVENAEFDGVWKNEKGEVTSNTVDPAIGQKDWTSVKAAIDYDIYTVYVYANEGIANIYIDGNAMEKGLIPSTDGMYANGFSLKVSAGEHEITYDLTNGWTGSAVFKVNGDAINGNKFTTTGTPGEADTVLKYTVQISGLEKSGFVPDSPDAPSDSGMGITDYLLIVLVVLIVVMAIIVAMRLMRS